MVGKYTEQHIMHLAGSYTIEVELPNGNKAKIVGKCIKSLVQSANDLYNRLQNQGTNSEAVSSNN